MELYWIEYTVLVKMLERKMFYTIFTVWNRYEGVHYKCHLQSNDSLSLKLHRIYKSSAPWHYVTSFHRHPFSRKIFLCWVGGMSEFIWVGFSSFFVCNIHVCQF